MGIPGLWEEVERVLTLQDTTLAAESAACVEAKGRPLRIAVDASVVIYKLRESTRPAAKYGGMNHPSRTFMTTACNLMIQGVQPVYIFDGPGRPTCKRDKFRPIAKRTNLYVPPPAPNAHGTRDIEQEYEFTHVEDLAKQVLDLMGVPRWDAPGEAEAECVALEKAGLVDGIYTSDGDALAFGGQCIYRARKNDQEEEKNDKEEKKKNDEELQKIQAADLETAGRPAKVLALAALLAGGDYRHGLRNCGFLNALRIVEKSAALEKLYHIGKSTAKEEARKGMLNGWRISQRDTFVGAVRNISRLIADTVPSDWPSAQLLGLCLRPMISDDATLEQLRPTIWIPKQPNIVELRAFTARMFGWQSRQRAKQFLHRLTPGLLANKLMAAGCQGQDATDLIVQAKAKQQRKDTANRSPVVKVSFMALEIAPIDYDGEPIVPGFEWDERDKKDPKVPYEEEYPEFLATFGAPSSLPRNAAGRNSGNSKRPAESDTASSSTKKAKATRRKPSAESTNTQRNSPSTVGTTNNGFTISGFRMPTRLDISFAGNEDVIDLT
ncbi:Flap endonuclease 1 [Fulvia fulva]|nr:Flap endonuclease 1 [Fulvia fulva]WPV36608.1 Flap endonuclease 1 [Fulvia fulva]